MKLQMGIYLLIFKERNVRLHPCLGGSFAPQAGIKDITQGITHQVPG
jgi:hypothetical protein